MRLWYWTLAGEPHLTWRKGGLRRSYYAGAKVDLGLQMAASKEAASNAVARQDSRDWVRRARTLWLLWLLPCALIIASSWTGNIVQTAGWAIGFTLMGASCVANARRCGRLHCIYTGPLFLLAAIASLLYGSGALPLGPGGWIWIGGIAAVATLLLWFVAEPLFGRYAGRCPSTARQVPAAFTLVRAAHNDKNDT